MNKCDKATRACTGRITQWHLWRGEDEDAYEIKLCAYHSVGLKELKTLGRQVPLPRPARANFELTPLKTTKVTKLFKK